MEHDLNGTVEDYRRRVRAQSEVTAKLDELVRGLEAGPAACPERVERADGGVEAAKSLRRARADFERAEGELKALKREYAGFRLREALGPDPLHVDDGTFGDAILLMTSGRLTRHEARAPRSGPIGFDAFRSLLLTDLPLSQLIENEAADRRAGALFDMFQEQTSTRNILRRWGALVARDPYVANILRCAGDAAARFAKCLAQFNKLLESVRIHYELKQQKVDRLSFALVDSKLVLQAANYWESIERVCPDEAAQLLEQFNGLHTAREELRKLRDELNGELRAFMKCFFPRYAIYVMNQNQTRRQSLGPGRMKPQRLCDYVLDQIDRTDFLLPRGGDMEIDVPRIPPEIAAFRRTKAYQRHRKQAERAAMADASTLEDGA